MSTRPISQQLLAEKIRAAVLEALRSGVNIETVMAAMKQTHDELHLCAPVVNASLDAVKHGNA